LDIPTYENKEAIHIEANDYNPYIKILKYLLNVILPYLNAKKAAA